MSTKPEISDEELREYMNFDELLDRRKAVVQKLKYIDLIRKGAILSASVITLSIVWFIYRGGTGEGQVVQETTRERISSPGKGEPVTPIVGWDSAETLQDPSLPVASAAKESAPAAEKTDAPQDEAPEVAPDTEADSHSVIDNNAAAYQYLEAEPVDGFPALYEYFSSELVYPREAMADSIQGVVTASFIIGVGGVPENIRLENSLGKAFDEEVKRLIENMPAWKPATVNGKPVPSRLSIPVTFRIQKVRNK